jgi:hypothetical protein
LRIPRDGAEQRDAKQAHPYHERAYPGLSKPMPAGGTAADMIACKHSALPDDDVSPTDETVEGPPLSRRPCIGGQFG